MTTFVFMVVCVLCPPADSTDEQCFRFSDCASCTANTRGCQWCEDRKCISASSNCTVVSPHWVSVKQTLLVAPEPAVFIRLGMHYNIGTSLVSADIYDTGIT